MSDKTDHVSQFPGHIGLAHDEAVTTLPISLLAATTAVVRMNHIHTGYWRLAVYFAPVSAANVNYKGHLMPAAIVPVASFVLQRDAEPSALNVDAAVVNPIIQAVTH